MTLRTAPSDRDVRNRLAAFRVDLGTRYVTICVVSLVAGRSRGEALYDEAHGARIVGGGGGGEGNREKKKKTFSQVFFVY
jgi:hypothetical protein